MLPSGFALATAHALSFTPALAPGGRVPAVVSTKPISAWLKDPRHPRPPSSVLRCYSSSSRFRSSPCTHSCRATLAVVPLQSQRREPAPQPTPFLSRLPQRLKGGCRPSFRPSRYRAATRNDAGIRPRLDAELRSPWAGTFRTQHWNEPIRRMGPRTTGVLQVAARYRLG